MNQESDEFLKEEEDIYIERLSDSILVQILEKGIVLETAHIAMAEVFVKLAEIRRMSFEEFDEVCEALKKDFRVYNQQEEAK